MIEQIETQFEGIFVNASSKDRVMDVRYAALEDELKVLMFSLAAFCSDEEIRLALLAVGYVDEAGNALLFNPNGDTALHLTDDAACWELMVELTGGAYQVANKRGQMPSDARSDRDMDKNMGIQPTRIACEPILVEVIEKAQWVRGSATVGPDGYPYTI